MRPQYRFTLDTNKRIAEPIGWDKMVIDLERNKRYWSLVEAIQLPLMFYGNSSDGDGGYDYLKEARRNGPDSQVEILIEISWDFGVTFETFFDGLLDLTELIDMETDRKFQCTIIRTSQWSRFINRGSVPVVVSDTATAQTLSLPNQEVRQLYIGIHSDDISYTVTPSSWGIIDWKIVVRSEINLKSNLPRVASTTLPVDLFEMQYDGYYTFTGDIFIASASGFPSDQITEMEVRIQINNNTPIAWTMEQLGTNGVNGRTHFYYNVQHSLLKGDQVRIYFFNTSGVSSKTFVWSDFVLQGLTVIADTSWPASTAQSFFIHDVARSIILEISGQQYFYSEYFGGINTDSIDYNQDGCGVYFRLLKGRHIRGSSLAVKPFSLSWDELWEGIDPIFCLGAGYETVLVSSGGGGNTQEMLVVMPREYFFDDSSNSVELTHYDMDFKLEVSYDKDFLLTSIKNGYKKWQAQSISGNDDPQTQQTRSTRFKTVGSMGTKDFEFLSSFVAAGLTIEQGRRMSEVGSQDWPLDEDTFIIQANGSISPDQVKTYSNDVVEGIENGDTRYNLRLTPASNFNRWIRWLSIGFQNYVGDLFRFVDGEGNTTMVFDNPGATGCEAEAGTYADEGGDIEIVTDSIFENIVYKFTVPFTWEDYKAIRDNKRKSILLNYRTNEGLEQSVVLFIRSMKYDPNKSSADFECWLKGVSLIDYEIAEQVKIDAAFLATNPRWDVDYITPEVTETLSITMTVSTLEGASSAYTGRTTVEAVARKVSNGGVAQGSADGVIKWVKNGITVHSVGFSPSDNVSSNSYTFTGVEAADILVVEIYEGLTS